jgi:ankyrin repeat protein
LHFAIAGGNPEIIDVATAALDDFVIATRVSAEFHRFELFRRFLTTKNTDLKANDIENGSIFHGIAAANHVRMILFCIEQGCDVNLKDGDGWTPLNCAIDYCALESVLILTSHAAIDVNAQDEYGITPLLRATMNGEVDVINVLLKHADIDVNAEGVLLKFFSFFFRFLCSFGYHRQTPLHRAAQNCNLDVLELLLTATGINVNQTDHLSVCLDNNGRHFILQLKMDLCQQLNLF